MHWNFCLYHNDIKICTALKFKKKKKNIRFKHGLDTMTSALMLCAGLNLAKFVRKNWPQVVANGESSCFQILQSFDPGFKDF